ncbi:MAG: hypothetical protein JNK76_24800 [Planctomycetales bacterium]|nr:hypothetical protein [Planctomycetales bacterium]
MSRSTTISSPDHGRVTARRIFTALRTQSSERWLYLFLAAQFVCQCALMAERMGGRWRIYFRAATFLSSLAMLLLLPGRTIKPHPASRLGIAAIAGIGLGLLHPYTNTLAGIAQWCLNAAIWAPLFWIGRIKLSPRTLWNAVIMLWAFHTISSVVGVLQVYYPERFSPSAEFVRTLMGQFADGLLITLDDGKQVWRPFGLSDTPGGAATSGSFAVIAGLVLFLSKPHWCVRFLSVFGVFTGIFCIYICEVRSIMAITVLGTCVMILLQVLQKRISRAAASMIILLLFAFGAISWTHSIGGESARRRARTLVEMPASSVYYQNRGVFLEHAVFEELPKYPLGAGVGRWGMMYAYFGDPTQPHSSALWSEIQFTGWLYDGGIPLVFFGYGAVITACYVTFKISLNEQYDRYLRDCAGIVTALNAGWLVVTFNYPLFIGQGGMIFWLLNAAVFAASVYGSPEPTRNSRYKLLP